MFDHSKSLHTGGNNSSEQTSTKAGVGICAGLDVYMGFPYAGYISSRFDPVDEMVCSNIYACYSTVNLSDVYSSSPSLLSALEDAGL